MCGINGILGFRTDAIEQIQKMNDVIIHRGPDAYGVWQSDDNEVTFGHRRLSIIDLSDTGAQPMVSESGNYTITYNGEIYNYLSIKKQLCAEYNNIHFRGTSDTELLLNAVEHYGIEKTLGLIKGMFAFAIYEKQTGKVYIARDRAGEKPLYYGEVADRFVFASDLGSLEQIDGFDNDVDGQILSSYFRGGYIPAPYTIYKDIYKLEPGRFLTVTPGENYQSTKVEKNIYWDIREIALAGQQNQFRGSFAEASHRLEELIKDSIKNQMISDVPLGAFLSGGIDSTLVVALLQSISTEPVKTFTIGFDNPKFNEAQYAKETANYLGTNHTEMYITKDDILGVIDNIPKAYTELFADSSQIPTMLVSQMTKKHVTVSLSGDSGDEFYCGYNSYKDVQKGLKILASKLPMLKGNLRVQFGKLVKNCGGNYVQLLDTVSRVLMVNTPEKWYRANREDNLLTMKLCKDKNQYADYVDSYQDGFLAGAEPNLMLMDMLQYLPDDILVKVDRAGMFYSLESRIPLLDRDVMEFAWTIPQEYKYDGITTKKVLRDILYRYVPQEMMDRPKRGFAVPLTDWLRGEELYDWASDMLQSSRQDMSDFINLNVVDKMWKRFMDSGENEQCIWRLIMLAQWFAVRR